MKIREIAKRFFKDEKGLETVEYAIIAGLIVVGTITTIVAVGGLVLAKFQGLEQGLSS